MTTKGKLLSAVLGIPLAVLSVVCNARIASAASLNAPGEISFTSSVVLTGVLDGNGNLIGTEFDFVSPQGGGVGDLDISLLSGSGGFESFNAETPGSPDGFLTDNIIIGTNPPSNAPGSAFVPFDLIRLFNTGSTPSVNPIDDTYFTATSVDSEPKIDSVGNDLQVSLGVEGIWRSPDLTTVNPSDIVELDGFIVFTTAYVNQSEANLFALLSTGEPILPPQGTSATAIAVPKDVPEPVSIMAALLAMGLGAVSFKDRKN